MLCRLFFQIYIKNKTEITEIDIAESKIQLISLQLNPREGEKEPTELKRESRQPPQTMYYSR